MRKKVISRGPALSRSGYGEHARFVLRALRSREDIFDIYLHNLNWGKTGWMWEERRKNGWIIIYSRQQSIVQMVVNLICLLQVTIPNEWEKWLQSILV
jgi:hypothetical protein